jgi:hypothetical protein
MHESYSPGVNSKRNVLLALIAAVAFIGAGCGGLGASGSVSPATFLLPGIGHQSPAPAPEEPKREMVENSPTVSAYTAIAE